MCQKLRQARTVIHFLGLVMVIKLLLWDNPEKWNTAGQDFSQSGFQKVSMFLIME